MSAPPSHLTLLRAASERGVATTGLGRGQLGPARRRILGATVAIGATMLAYSMAFLTVWADSATPPGQVVGWSSTVVFAALAVFVWRAPPTRGRLVFASAALHLVLGAGLAVMEPFDLGPSDRPFTLISWNCVNVLLVPVLVPAAPRVLVPLTFGVAALSGLGFWALGGVAGVPTHSPDVLASLALPPFVCAAVAGLTSNVVSGLRRDLSLARRLGAYELVERLGEGGMGEVWRGTHRFLARPAAIKLIRPEVLGGTQDTRSRAARRFEREAQAIAALESPHTVELYDFGVAESGAFYYVMELLRGVDLQRLVDLHGPMPPERAVHFLLQACESLAEAHGLGLVHRDVKPANLFVGPRGTADDVLRVLDFGLVAGQRVEGVDAMGLTNEGQIQGTPTTMAPEAATHEAPVDGRADVYALGCVAYFLVTGRDVFRARSAMDMVVAHVTRAPEPPSVYAPSPLPEAYDAAVLGCLAKHPDDRIPSADALAARLRAVRDDVEPWTSGRARAWWTAHAPHVVRPRRVARSSSAASSAGSV